MLGQVLAQRIDNGNNRTYIRIDCFYHTMVDVPCNEEDDALVCFMFDDNSWFTACVTCNDHAVARAFMPGRFSGSDGNEDE